ncbi:MFS transporter [Domibacillus robiginosus]|uniref:MFS transporter n=1 Tax=Domibacillus robiginosus TaxID=1071054 RepID=UPI000AC2BCC4|nr:MFS transporter [Domibacillus robiginosus]
MRSLLPAFSRQKNDSFITILLFWCGLVLLSSMYITLPLTTLFMDSLGITSAQTAWIGSSFSLCYALGCLLYGPFSDKYGRKIFLSVSISLLTVITIGIGFVESFPILLILRGLQGLVAAAFAPIALVYAGEIFPPHKRLTAIGFISSGLLMASIIGQVFSGMVGEAFGWHAIFFILGALYFVTALAVLFFLPKEQTSRTEESILQKFGNMAVLLKNSQLLFAFSITFVLLLSLVGMYSVLGSYLSSPRFDLTSGEILAVRGAGIIGMLFSPFAGQLAQKIGRGAVLRSGLALAAIGLLVIGFSPALSILVLASIVFVAGIALVTPVVISLVSQLAGNARGSAVSFNAFILFLGASAGPGLVMGFSKTEQYVLALNVLSAVMIIAFLASLFIKAEGKKLMEPAAKKQISP